MKKFIISESERNDIRKMYGLIKEQGKTSVDEDKEITDYLDYYLKNNKCNDIAKNLEEFKSSAAYLKLSKDEQKKLDDGITGLRNPNLAIIFGNIPCDKGTPKCDCIKNYMKEELVQKLKTDRDKVIVQTCEFTKKFPPQKPLSACSPKVDVTTPTNKNTNTGTNTNTTIDTVDNTKKNEPIIINTNTVDNTKKNEPIIINTNTGTNTKKNEPIIINTNTGTNTKKNEPIIINTNTDTTTPTTTTGNSSDYELDTPQKIQEFQTWMDKNHGKWAYSKKYNRNYSVDGKPVKGYGRMGPNTTKAWNNTEYKNTYLKEKGID